MDQQERDDFLARMRAPSHGWMRQGPLVTLVHSMPANRPLCPVPTFSSSKELPDCHSSESLVDVLLDHQSILALGVNLPDRTRMVDLFVIERLIRASRWSVPISTIRLCDTLVDPAVFVFANNLLRRGVEEVSPNTLKNSIKRLRQVFRLMYPNSSTPVIRWEIKGYLFDLASIAVRVVHVPQ